MLIFPADNTIINVQVLINEEVGCERASFEENLYTCPWSPAHIKSNSSGKPGSC